MTKATSGPIEFESDFSEVSYELDSADNSDDFDADFDSDSDDLEESGDYDVSMNYYPEIDTDFIGTVNLEEYKDAFALKFDLRDAEKYIRENHKEERYRLKEIIIDKNVPTDTGYNAVVRAYFKGHETVLRQGVCLSYDFNETFNSWDIFV